MASRKTELFLAAKRWIRAHPEADDQDVADAIGAKLLEAEELIAAARKDHAADSLSPS